jgi:hypothetical protein
LLPNGNVLVVGGGLNSAPVWFSSAERYDSVPGPITLLNPTKLPGGALQFAFTGAANGVYTIWMTTALPWNSGTWLQPVQEFSPGLFVFSGSQLSETRQQFYRVAEGAWPVVGR